MPSLADTTAAIRRYQIRNGLQITGELNAETQKSLGVQGKAPATPAPAISPPPVRPAPAPAPPENREDVPAGERAPVMEDDETIAPPTPPAAVYPPGGAGSPNAGLFQGTPYETAPIDVQRRVIFGTQSLLAQRGYYRSGVDGVFGPGTEFALRAFQSRFGIQPSGWFDMETLSALGLLPGQQAPGVTAPTRRVIRTRPFVTPRGERIYIPRPF